MCDIEVSDPGIITGFFERKNNWLYPPFFYVGSPIGSASDRMNANSLTLNTLNRIIGITLI